MSGHGGGWREVGDLADLCAVVAAGELPAAQALRRAPFPPDHAREALLRAAVP